MIKAREDRTPWSDYFMLLAQVTATRSPDPHTQVGACLVDKSNHVLSLGYNGLPKGMIACMEDWSREGPESKYLYIVHAELNAVLNARLLADATGATLYTTLYPCNECSKAIVQTGISRVVYLNFVEASYNTASRKILTLGGVVLQQHTQSASTYVLSKPT